MSQDGRRSARGLVRPHLNDLPPYGAMESVAVVAKMLGANSLQRWWAQPSPGGRPSAGGCNNERPR